MGWFSRGVETIKDAVKDIPVIGSIAKSVVDLCPKLEDEVTVEVVGQPRSSKKTLYYLALSVANSLVKNFNTQGKIVPAPIGMIMLEYDAADNWVRCTLRYNTPLLRIAVADRKQGQPEFLKDYSGDLVVYAGPKCDVVGATHNFVGQAPGIGLPVSSTTQPAPKLPFADRTILTNCPSVVDNATRPAPLGVSGDTVAIVPNSVVPTGNPVPVGDNRSRGGVTVPASSGEIVDNDDCCARSLRLVPMIFAALSDPGSFASELFE